MRRLIARTMSLYRRSVLHPHLSRPLARGLGFVQRFSGPRVVVEDLGAFRMRLERDQFIDAHILQERVWEPETTRMLLETVRSGDVCIDVGAHIGWTALTMAAASGGLGKVVVLEPSPWAYERLVGNIALNRDLTRLAPIEALAVAAGAQALPRTEMVLPNGFRLDGRDTATRYDVEVITLDALAARLSRVDVIKTDTDGHELGVLEGAAKLIEAHRPAVLFELSPRHLRGQGVSVDELLDWFLARGYRFIDEYRPDREASRQDLHHRLGGTRDLNVLARPA